MIENSIQINTDREDKYYLSILNDIENLSSVPLFEQAEICKKWSLKEPEELRQMLLQLNTFLTKFLQRYYVPFRRVELLSILEVLNMLYCTSYYNKNNVEGAVEGKDYQWMDVGKTNKLAKCLGLKYFWVSSIPIEEFTNSLLNECLDKSDNECWVIKYYLNNFPFIMSMKFRAKYITTENNNRMEEKRRSYPDYNNNVSNNVKMVFQMRARRNHIFSDTMARINHVETHCPRIFEIGMYVEFEEEEAQDFGGVSKEYFHLIISEIFLKDKGLFIETSNDHNYWILHSDKYNFVKYYNVGILIGLAAYNNIALDLRFPKIFYKKLMGKKGTFEDLKEWDAVLASSLQRLLDYEGEDLEDIFMTSFKVDYELGSDEIISEELVEDGDKIMVNQENKKQFVDLYADFLLNKNIQIRFEALRKGFLKIMGHSSLFRIFRTEELEELFCGHQDYEFKNLEYSTVYEDYTYGSRTIKHFWEVIHNFTTEDKSKFLKFVTGSDRLPIGGLGELHFQILRFGPDSGRLPRSSTCFNYLLLPEYDDKDKLEHKLRYAIENCKEFGLF